MSNPHGNPATLRPPWGPDNPPPKSPGRPPKRPQSEAYEDWLREPVSKEKIAQFRLDGIILKDSATNATVVAMAMGRKAIRGDVNAAKEMREAVEGKSISRIELTGDQKAPEFVVVYATAVPGERKIEHEKTVVEMANAVNEARQLSQAEVVAIVEAIEEEK